MVSRKKEKEKAYYEPLKENLGRLFKEKDMDIHLEITAENIMSDELKSKISTYKEIIFSFLKKAFPDITGYVEKRSLSGFLVVEFKRNEISIDDIYQTKKYSDLFEAKFTFLISLKPIPEEIKRLLNAIPEIMRKPSIYRAFSLAQYDGNSHEFVEWFKENPFKESIYWK